MDSNLHVPFSEFGAGPNFGGIVIAHDIGGKSKVCLF
jgi:hypothetical protein